MNNVLGTFCQRSELTTDEATLVKVAMSATHRAYCFQSDFPVGSAVLAANHLGHTCIFAGCNVENEFFPATICAERNAVTTAVMEGYTRLRAAAVFCRKFPGGSPCGVCRQVLTQFGRGGVLLNVIDHDGNVNRALIDELLPAASGAIVLPSDQSAVERRLVKAALVARTNSHVPYSKTANAAILVATNSKGKRCWFKGAVIDNASYGASVGCESAAMIAARLAGFVNDPTLVVTISACRGLKTHNPIDGECLQILREFGRDAKIILVAEDKSIVRTTLIQLLPDSFGPESL